MAPVPLEALATGLLVGLLIAELALGGWLLRLSRGRVAALWLGCFVLVHAASLIGLALYGFGEAWGAATGNSELADLSDDIDLLRLMSLEFGISSLLPGLLVAFALAFPTPLPALRRRPALWVVPFASAPLVVAANFLSWLGPPIFRRCRATGTQVSCQAPSLGEMVGIGAAAVALLVGAIVAVAILVARRQRAKTAVRRARLRFMLRAFVLPTAFGVGCFLPAFVAASLGASGALGHGGRLLEFVGLVGIAVFVLAPSFALAYGLLRDHIVDVDVRVRKGLQRAFLIMPFILVFFAATEAAEEWLAAETGSALFGVVGAGLLAIGIRPMRRAAARVADRVVPGARGRPVDRRVRREEVYRATFDDLRQSGNTGRQGQRALDALRRALGLSAAAVERIEREILAESRASERNRFGLPSSPAPPSLPRRGAEVVPRRAR